MTKPQYPRDQSENTREETRDIALRITSAKRGREYEGKKASGNTYEEMNSVARGMRIATEFVAAILVGAFIGYLIDLGLGSSPWGLLVVLMMGFVAGILNVTRVVMQMNAASPSPVTAPDIGTNVASEDSK